MTRLDEATKRLARRMSVARLGLAQGGPVELLDAMIAPVESALADVREQMDITEQPTFDAVDEPIGPATTAVLADIVSPVPARHPEHHHEAWQIRDDGRGGQYCAACGEPVGGGLNADR